MTHPDTLQRAAFEAWAASELEAPISWQQRGTYDFAWRVWQAALQAQPTSGTQPPPEPTAEMIKLGLEAYKPTKRTIFGTGGNEYKMSPEQRMRNAYYAMRWHELLQAQPTPPVGQAERYMLLQPEGATKPYMVPDPDGNWTPFVTQFTAPQPTPDAEAIRLALESMKGVMSWITNWSPEFVYDPDWTEYQEKHDAVIAALEKVKGPTP